MTPRRAWLASVRPRALEPLFDALGTVDVTFGATSTGLALGAEIAAQVLPGADPLMLVTRWTGMPPGAFRRRW